uniref:Uncharacterized protein n=1 Tax=Tanacetum cinerariifolium TaxID=118510 RepID=A0A6L2L067_TANCI|nr:hypothetical protein [Tanacetum cinerariifolium]
MMNTLEESRGINLAWIIFEHLCKHVLGLKENRLICGGNYMTKIGKSLWYLMNEEVEKCSKLIECEKWNDKMFSKEFDLENYTLLRPTLSPPPTRVNKPILHTPLMYNPNFPPYPYPYVPYPYPYTHYPDMGNQPHGGGHYEAPGDGYFAILMPAFRGTSIVPSSGYEVGGSSRAMQDEDDDDAL